MKGWLIQHAQVFKQVLSRFSQHKLNTLLICLSIGVTLALPSILYMVLNNLNALVSDVKSESHLSVFLTVGHDETAVQTIKTALENNAMVKSFYYVNKEDALKQLLESNNNNEAISALDGNPLPDAFFVEPKNLDSESISTLKNQLSSMDAIEEVIVDSAWITRLNYLLTLGKKAMFILTGLLGFALIAVIGNTIRMQVLTQRDEIELSQLIGATKSFIRRPFLYAGALYGLTGGVLALTISWLVILFFNQTVKQIALNYHVDFSLNFMSFSLAVTTLAISTAIGWLASYVSISLPKNQA